MKHRGIIDMNLWHACQKTAYPERRMTGVSNEQPFHISECTPKMKPASWLYHTLAADRELLAQVFPS
jgi:hypothetical protein